MSDAGVKLPGKNEGSSSPNVCGAAIPGMENTGRKNNQYRPITYCETIVRQPQTTMSHLLDGLLIRNEISRNGRDANAQNLFLHHPRWLPICLK